MGMIQPPLEQSDQEVVTPETNGELLEDTVEVSPKTED